MALVCAGPLCFFSALYYRVRLGALRRSVPVVYAGPLCFLSACVCASFTPARCVFSLRCPFSTAPRAGFHFRAKRGPTQEAPTPVSRPICGCNARWNAHSDVPAHLRVHRPLEERPHRWPGPFAGASPAGRTPTPMSRPICGCIARWNPVSLPPSVRGRNINSELQRIRKRKKT